MWTNAVNWEKRIGFIRPEETQYISKGWGFEEWIANSKLYCAKILFVKQGRRTSWHYHKVKLETLKVLTGEAIIYYSTDDCISLYEPEHPQVDYRIARMSVLKSGDIFHVPVRLRHQIYSCRDTQILEVSTFHEDSDSIRLIKGD